VSALSALSSVAAWCRTAGQRRLLRKQGQGGFGSRVKSRSGDQRTNYYGILGRCGRKLVHEAVRCWSIRHVFGESSFIHQVFPQVCRAARVCRLPRACLFKRSCMAADAEPRVTWPASEVMLGEPTDQVRNLRLGCGRRVAVQRSRDRSRAARVSRCVYLLGLACQARPLASYLARYWRSWIIDHRRH
jgi:hypothetical protein